MVGVAEWALMESYEIRMKGLVLSSQARKGKEKEKDRTRKVCDVATRKSVSEADKTIKDTSTGRMFITAASSGITEFSLSVSNVSTL